METREETRKQTATVPLWIKLAAVSHCLVAFFFGFIMVPAFEKTYEEVLEGVALPGITQFVLRTNPALFVILGLLGALFLVGLAGRRQSPRLQVGILVAFVLLVGITVVALILPMLSLVDRTT